MQSDTNHMNILKQTFGSIPSLVTVLRDVAAAEGIIADVSDILGIGPASRPSAHPLPVSAGVRWEELSDDAKQKFDAVLDALSADSSYSQISPGQVQEAQKRLERGYKELAELPQQGYSGMVQRNS